MAHVEVSTVHISENGVLLMVLDHTRQRAYAKMAAERFKLDRLLEQVAKQAQELEVAKTEYEKSVAAMNAVANRNQF